MWCQRKTNGYKGVNIQDFTSTYKRDSAYNEMKERPFIYLYFFFVPHRLMAKRPRVQRVDSLSQARLTGLPVAREEHQHREPEHRVRRSQQ